MTQTPVTTARTRRTAARALAALLAAAVAAPLTATAQDFDAQVAARQGQMRIMALHLGVLAGMARGTVDYDAEMAQSAADNLAAVATLDQRAMWPEGSDSFALDGTRAEPTIWDDYADFLTKWDAFGTQAAAMQTAAAQGLDALRPALGGLGGTCQSCHEAHQAPPSD